MKPLVALFAASAWLALVAAGQDARDPAAREVLAAHISHGIGTSPFDSDLWHDGTNAALIVGARAGLGTAALQQIAPDAPDLAARLARLQDAGFLRRDGDLVRAAFPILIGPERDAYFALVSRAAERIEREMRRDWQALVDELGAAGWAEWSYHFVWSQTMDSGFSWAPMMQETRVPPLSQVIVWVVHPAHPFKTGTNYYPDTELRDEMMAVTWRPGAANTIVRVGAQWPALLPAALTGRPGAEGPDLLRELDLLDARGRVRIPVVRRHHPLYGRLERLGTRHVETLATHLPLARLTALTGADDTVTFVMAYHDVSWEVLRLMVQAGLMSVPAALQEGAPDTSSMAGVCAVVDAHPVLLRELRKALGLAEK